MFVLSLASAASSLSRRPMGMAMRVLGSSMPNNIFLSTGASNSCSGVSPERIKGNLSFGSFIRNFHATRCKLLSTKSKDGNKAKFVLWDSLSQSMKEVPVSGVRDHEKTNNDNSATNNTKGNSPDNTKALAWYTCGPTTYSAMHLGHARTYVWLDMMRRVLEFVAAAQGAPPPLFVMNVTDIDDKILAASVESQSTVYKSPMAISRQAETNFWKDMDRLGCAKPHITTRVTEFVDSDIIPYIDRLEQQGMAYVTDDGVYFDVQTFEAKVGPSSKYGKLAGAAIQSSSPTPTINDESDPQKGSVKRDRRDFALWKARKSGEEVYWPSPWGDGRPGWHIECSAMIEAVQQQFKDTHQFLVHAGGWDLKFPHHTNEIAQAEAFHHGKNGGCLCPLDHPNDNHKEWIPHWVHTGHLMIKDSKMSKSLKNFLTVDELWFDYDESCSSQLDSPADDFRLWCLMGGSYAHREEYGRSKLLLARQKRERILRFLLDGERWIQQCCQDEVFDNDDLGIQFDKRWNDDDRAFFVAVNSASTDAHRSLLNNMQGTKYVDGLVRISDAGSAHIRDRKAFGSANTEPVKAALQATRNLLSLVGFSELTVRAGLQSSSAASTKNTPDSYIAGGEAAVIEELVRFRAAVRAAALDDVKSKKGTDNAKSILLACDELRDALPKMGLEVMDKKGSDSAWRFCVPAKERKL